MAAKFLGVAPWDLEHRGIEWLNWGLMMLSADNKAEIIQIEAAHNG